MRGILIVLSCSILINGIRGASLQPSVTIDENANELADLFEKCWNAKPAIINQMDPFIDCKIIDQCCGAEHRSQLISFFAPAGPYEINGLTFDQMIKICINSTTHHKEKEWCPSARLNMIGFWEARQDPDLTNYVTETRPYSVGIERLANLIGATCNDEEIHAAVCQTSSKLTERCARKILQKTYDIEGNKAYQNLITLARTTLTSIYEKSPKKSNHKEDSN